MLSALLGKANSVTVALTCDKLEEEILAAGKPGQDNYTAGGGEHVPSDPWLAA